MVINLLNRSLVMVLERFGYIFEAENECKTPKFVAILFWGTYFDKFSSKLLSDISNCLSGLGSLIRKEAKNDANKRSKTSKNCVF